MTSAGTRSLSRYGIELRLPAGWDARIYRRAPAPGETTYPVVHAGNFALPESRGDFGSGAVEEMDPRDVLVVIFEYGNAAASKPLFAEEGRPTPRTEDFGPRRLQRILPGQSGSQYFYNEAGRAFSLYVVLGSHARRSALVREANELLVGLTVNREEAGWQRSASG